MLLQELFLLFFSPSLHFFPTSMSFFDLFWCLFQLLFQKNSFKTFFLFFFFFLLFLSPKVMEASKSKKLATCSISPHTFFPTMYMHSTVPVLLRNLWLQGRGMKLKLHWVKCYFLHVKGFQHGHFWVLFRVWIGLHLWQKAVPSVVCLAKGQLHREKPSSLHFRPMLSVHVDKDVSVGSGHPSFPFDFLKAWTKLLNFSAWLWKKSLTSANLLCL